MYKIESIENNKSMEMILTETLTTEQKLIIKKAIFNAVTQELLDTNQIDLSVYHKMCQKINKLKE